MLSPLKNPNDWSCLPAAFAIALDIPFSEVIDCVGHDGSEISDASLPDPLCRKGFHMQEMIKMCLRYNIAATPIELQPAARVEHPRIKTSKKLFNTGEWVWFNYNLFTSCGVIECKTMSGVGHAMAYEGCVTHASIYDPAIGDYFKFERKEDAEDRGRFLFSLWRLDDIGG